MVGKFEIGKDTVQVLTESAATHVGRIATILTGAVRDVAHEVGEWATEAFEMREAASRAEAAAHAEAAEHAEAAAHAEAAEHAEAAAHVEAEHQAGDPNYLS